MEPQGASDLAPLREAPHPALPLPARGLRPLPARWHAAGAPALTDLAGRPRRDRTPGRAHAGRRPAGRPGDSGGRAQPPAIRARWALGGAVARAPLPDAQRRLPHGAGEHDRGRPGAERVRPARRAADLRARRLARGAASFRRGHARRQRLRLRARAPARPSPPAPGARVPARQLAAHARARPARALARGPRRLGAVAALAPAPPAADRGLPRHPAATVPGVLGAAPWTPAASALVALRPARAGAERAREVALRAAVRASLRASPVGPGAPRGRPLGTRVEQFPRQI